MPRANDGLLQMVAGLQGAGHGDAGRLAHIAETIARGRVVYDSDRRYVERKFAELGKSTAHTGIAGDASPPIARDRLAAVGNPRQRPTYRTPHRTRTPPSPPASGMRKASNPVDRPPSPPPSPLHYAAPAHAGSKADLASFEPDLRAAPANPPCRDADRSLLSPKRRRAGARFKAGIALLVLGLLVLAFDAWVIIAWGSQATFVTGPDLVLLASIGGIGLALFIGGLVLALLSRR